MNYNEMANNKAYLRGAVASKPEFSHEVMGEGFYEFTLAISRLSGDEDFIPVTISERIMSRADLSVGTVVTVSGQFRSYNKPDEGRSKLMLTVFARELLENDFSQNPNVIELSGYVCKKPVYRTTPFGREITDVLLAINRAYNKSDYIPMIAWGRNARFASDFEIGQKICVSGRIQSRNYTKTTGDVQTVKTAFEVSAAKIELLTEEANSTEKAMGR